MELNDKELTDSELQQLSASVGVTTEDIEREKDEIEESGMPILTGVFGMRDIPINTAPVSKLVLSSKQKNSIEVIAYHLTTQRKKVDPVNIHKEWPMHNKAIREKAGPQPTITAIAEHLQSDAYADAMLGWGVEVGTNPGGLTMEQIAVITNIGDAAKTTGLNSRLKESGVSWSTFNAWRKIPAFEQALEGVLGNVLNDAVLISDGQLAAKAQNGDLNAIKYLNEMVGRSPNNKQAVDAVAFARIVLEAVQKKVQDPAIIHAIAAEIELAAKGIGLTS